MIEIGLNQDTIYKFQQFKRFNNSHDYFLDGNYSINLVNNSIYQTSENKLAYFSFINVSCLCYQGFIDQFIEQEYEELLSFNTLGSYAILVDWEWWSQIIPTYNSQKYNIAVSKKVRFLNPLALFTRQKEPIVKQLATKRQAIIDEG